MESQRKINVAKNLLIEEAKIRKRAMLDTEVAVSKLIAALKDREGRTFELEKELKEQKLENRMLDDLLLEQTERCVASERLQKQMEEKLANVSELLCTTVEQAKLQAAQLKEWKEREAKAVGEINRRAVQQAELRESLKKLEARISEDQALRNAEMLQKKSKEEDEGRSFFEERLQTSEELNVCLQAKIDEQTVETLHLKAEISKCEKAIISYEQLVEDQQLKLSDTETEVAKQKRLLADATSQMEDLEQTASRAAAIAAASASLPKEDQHHDELVQLRKELHDLKERTRAEETNMQKEIVRLNKDLLEKEDNHLRIAELEGELAGAKTKLTSSAKEILRLNNELLEKDSHQARITELEGELTVAKSKLASSAKAIETLELSGMEKEAALLQDFEANRNEIARLQNQLSTRQTEQTVLAEVQTLYETCRTLQEETNSVKKTLQAQSSHHNNGLAAPPPPPLSPPPPPSQFPEMQDKELIQELVQLRDICLGQREDANLLKRQLNELRTIQQVNLQKVGNVEVLEAKLADMKASEEEVKKEAEIVRDEASRLGSATKHMVATLLAIKRQLGKEHVVDHDEVEAAESKKESTAQSTTEDATVEEAEEVWQRNRGSSVTEVLGNVEKEAVEAEQPSPRVHVPPKPTPKDKRPKIVLQGSLTKSPPSSAYFRRWRTRWFVLTDAGGLYYFKSRKNLSNPRGVINLKQAQVLGPKSSLDEKSNKFTIKSGKRVYELLAGTTEQLREWLAAINTVMIDLDKQGRETAVDEDETLYGPFMLYELLGCNQDASEQDIEDAYEEATKQFHPDVNPDPNTAKFEAIKKAYNILGTPSLRNDYDTSLSVRRLFIEGFVGILHPSSNGFYQHEKLGSSTPMRFYSDEVFSRLFWSVEGDDSGSESLSWNDLENVQNGEESKDLLKLPIERSRCTFCLITKQPGPVVHIEVDDKDARDKIVHALKLLMEAYYC